MSVPGEKLNPRDIEYMTRIDFSPFLDHKARIFFEAGSDNNSLKLFILWVKGLNIPDHFLAFCF